MMLGLVLALCGISIANAAETTYHLQKLDTPRDVLAVNENFRSLSGGLSKLDDELQSQVTALSSAVTSAGYAELKATQTFSGINSFVGKTVIGASSTVYIAGGIYTNASFKFGECVPGSTATFSLSGSTAIVSNIGSGSSNAGCWLGVAILVDGEYPESLGYQTAIMPVYTAGNAVNLSFANYPVFGLAAGQHSFCLTFAEAPNGTCTGTYPATANMPGISIFRVEDGH